MILGITGSIACGKSKVIEYIKIKGYDVFSLDDISHDCFNDKYINDCIKKTFDIKSEGKVTREEVGKIVFGNPDEMKKLNSILHPVILLKMNELIDKARNDKRNLFIEVPLLYELKMNKYFDKVILIYVNKENQLNRLMNRNDLTKEEAMKRINSQIDIETKKEKALKNNDFLIDNNYNLDYTYKAIDNLLLSIENNNI